MAKVVFIVNSLQNQRCIKRITEFISEGADVEVYAYTRNKEQYSSVTFPVTHLGNIESIQSYTKRFPLLYKTIKKALRTRINHDDDIFYLFGLDIAIVFRLMDRSHRFVYEESDLVHTYVSNHLAKTVLEFIDKRIIRKSYRTVLTSEGFAEYHFGKNRPANIVIIPNKLNRSIYSLDWKVTKHLDKNVIRVAFVGKPRFRSVVNFAKILCEFSSQYEFHIYGGPILEEVDGFEGLRKYPNYFYHGPFKNPDDLPRIYSSIDLVLSTYDVDFENVRYAEPNKIYEALFFNTPIIVSEGTYLEKKVKEMGIGYSINPLNDSDVRSFLFRLSKQSIEEVAMHCSIINKDSLIDSNTQFITSLIKE